jgi:hypothetical protein
VKILLILKEMRSNSPNVNTRQVAQIRVKFKRNEIYIQMCLEVQKVETGNVPS